MEDYKKLLPEVVAIAKQAGAAIMPIYERREFNIKLKADDSPLTEADLLANEIIMHALEELAPDIPYLSEEGAEVPYSERKKWQRYWLVDPLDGTNEFISHTNHFTINIALIVNHKPVIGVSFAPALEKCYYACQGSGAFCELASGEIQKIQTRKVDPSHIDVIVSHTIGIKGLEKFLAQLPSFKIVYFGGSLKICLIAEGNGDIYPRLGTNCEWDTAAPQCILEEAGGALLTFDFKPLQYNTKDSLYNPHFLVVGDPGFAWGDYF